MNPCGAPASTVLRPPNYCLREHRGWGRSGLIRTSRPKGLDFSFYSPTACVIEALDASLQADGSSAWAPMRWTPESLSAIPLELRSPNLSALQKIKLIVVKDVAAIAAGGQTMSFGLYAIGFLIFIGGLAYGAHLLHVPQHWIVVGAIVLLGLGIVTGVTATRQKDPAE